MKSNSTKLTSVKVLDDLHTQFRTISFEKPITFQKLVNRTIHLYLSNADFANMIDNCKSLSAVDKHF